MHAARVAAAAASSGTEFRLESATLQSLGSFVLIEGSPGETRSQRMNPSEAQQKEQQQ